MCFHPHTNVTLPLMTEKEIIEVVDVWAEQVTDIGKRMRWVQLFENKGQAMGCSNPHPHCQIWASSYLPTTAERKDKAQRAYLAKHGKPLLVEYVELELKDRSRIVVENEHWVAVVPFWAVWPCVATPPPPPPTPPYTPYTHTPTPKHARTSAHAHFTHLHTFSPSTRSHIFTSADQHL
jgi:galactose-1-phosphate uridylyltransferase (family 1)